ncbi:hypothetical protein SRHO_G00117320 [Serrasalmus rhombeus]
MNLLLLCRHIENWSGLQTLRDVDMALYTGLQRLTIMNCNLRGILPRAFVQNPQLRYMALLSVANKQRLFEVEACEWRRRLE